MSVVIELNGKTKSLESGESYTFPCAGKPLSASSNLTVTFNTVGYLSYNGLITVGQDGNSRRFACAGKTMITDVVITAGEYGVSSPLPVEVASEAEMTSILTNATASSVGAVYKYVGETTSTYTHGALYVIDIEGNAGEGDNGVYT